MTVKDLLHYSEAIEKIKHNKDQQNASVPSELFYVYHTKEEGFKTNEFNGCDHCGVRLANGNILLPSLNGLVGFRPGDIMEDRADGNIILDKAEVNRKTIIPSHDTLYFPMDPGQTKLHFSTAYFGNNYNLKLSYVLVKESRLAAPPDWIPMDKDLDIEFSSLNSGNYTLIIRKLNGFGINNYTIKKIYFIVPLKWYQTIWAEILLLFILIGLVYLYNWYSVRVVKRENIKLEELVSRRTSRLNQTLTDLEESKNEMSRQVHMLSRLLTSMTHDIQSPLNYIRLTSGNIPKMIQKAQYEDVAMLGEMIADSSGRMSNLLKGLLDYIKAHVFQNSLHYEAINLQLLVDEKFEIFKNMITENGSDFKNEISSNTVVYCDYQMLGIMIHNLIDNAAKFTRKGTIRIYFNASGENEGELVISNTTVGVPTEIQEMINTPETESIHLPMQVGQTRTSLGLLIVKEIAALVGVGLRVTQTDVTSFHLLFK
ncbi:sensor histidine kinase [Dyadobacter subterraneus]|uniref:histidine kinase n=1 Tax=Dyadobacter subterraneus TaxID=2773304 RepID=A0ABR9W7J0_9BACT|nr:HAMP domain-containing sensor histidine kinase [Dyadobacter subterraneus]MBE9461423.1 HAMP domain-containing histidine kinase [Dyadobacter subterraneus]